MRRNIKESTVAIIFISADSSHDVFFQEFAGFVRPVKMYLKAQTERIRNKVQANS